MAWHVGYLETIFRVSHNYRPSFVKDQIPSQRNGWALHVQSLCEAEGVLRLHRTCMMWGYQKSQLAQRRTEVRPCTCVVHARLARQNTYLFQTAHICLRRRRNVLLSFQVAGMSFPSHAAVQIYKVSLELYCTDEDNLTVFRTPRLMSQLKG